MRSIGSVGVYGKKDDNNDDDDDDDDNDETTTMITYYVKNATINCEAVTSAQ